MGYHHSQKGQPDSTPEKQPASKNKSTRNAIVGIAVIIIVVTVAYMSIYANNPFKEIFSVSESIINPGSVTRRILNKEKVTAPNFTGIERWLNTPDGQAISLNELKGKVVLLDFWTYTCINCIRTLPYITEWDQKV